MKPVIVTKPLGKYRPGDIFTPAKDAPVATWIRRAKVRPLTPEEQEAWEAKQARDITATNIRRCVLIPSRNAPITIMK